MAKKFVSNKDETVVMFKNPFLESLSRIHWSVPLFIYVPVVLFFLYKSVFILNIPILTVVICYIAGIIAWTFAEYALHRFVFHTELPGKFGKRMHFVMHGVHHDYPKDSKRLVMVPTVSIPLALLFYGIFYLLVGPVYTAPVFAAFVSGYLFYDMTHYAIHHYSTKNSYWLKLKQHHSLHHYGHPDQLYGVSSKLWDHVFQSFPEDKVSANEVEEKVANLH